MNKTSKYAKQCAIKDSIIANGVKEILVQLEQAKRSNDKSASRLPFVSDIEIERKFQELKKSLENSSSRAMQVVEPMKHEPIILFDQSKVHDEVKMFNVNIQGSYETHEKLSLIEQLQSLISDNSSTQECVSLAQYKLMGLLNSI